MCCFPSLISSSLDSLVIHIPLQSIIHCICFSLGPAGPAVGFAATYYTASEDDGFVIVTVAVLQGTIELGDTISLVFTTQENNASGEHDILYFPMIESSI